MRYIMIVPIILQSLIATAQSKAEQNATGTPPPWGGQGQKGKGVNVGGTRGSGIIYIIDVNPVQNITEVEFMPVKELRPDLNTPTSFKLSREDINRLPLTDITDMITLSPSVYQLQRGTETSFSGGRGGDILFVIDGMQIARR